MSTTNAILKGIKSNFYNLLKVTPQSPFEVMTSRVKSNSNEEKYYIQNVVPGIKELIDEVTFDEIGDKSLTVVNKEFYNGVMDDRNRIEDSKEYLTNTVELGMRSIAAEWNDFDAKQISDLLYLGSTVTNTATSAYAFDATAMFSTSRPNIPGSTTISNKYTKTGDTQATFEADYAGARSQLMTMTDKSGRPYNSGANIVVIVPPQLEMVAKQTLNKEMSLVASTGTLKSNLYAGDAQVIVNHWAAATSSGYAWYLVNVKDKDVVLVQDRKAPEWFMNDDNKKKWVEYYTKGRRGYAYLNPFKAIRVSSGG